MLSRIAIQSVVRSGELPRRRLLRIGNANRKTAHRDAFAVAHNRSSRALNAEVSRISALIPAKPPNSPPPKQSAANAITLFDDPLQSVCNAEFKAQSRSTIPGSSGRIFRCCLCLAFVLLFYSVGDIDLGRGACSESEIKRRQPRGCLIFRLEDA
jgi:hypothetical protein